MKSIVENIETIRKEKGFKQEVMAEMLGVTQGTYSGWLTQNQDIKYGKLLEIANKFEMSIIDLIAYPQRYVPESVVCETCKEKDAIIKSLNEYIGLLKKTKLKK
ncbi:hypothetical protein SAMD00024442_6_5 [Candidatus Symbiothrix dinenymphae]|nr:hypothetical protein SAMD00024442_6_5 [Candidatus Symbiothrix dinenymphae]